MNADFLGGDLFKPETISEETASFNKKLESILSRFKPTHKKTPEEVREETESGKGIFGPVKRLDEAKDRIISINGREILVRVVIPEKVNGVYLHFHGGGFVLMRPYVFDPSLVETAKRSNVALVSVDYRLAPENPYPAAADDCEDAALWLIENAKKEFGSERLIIGGESAGANLSAVTMVRMRDRHGYSGFLGANLVFGVFDMAMTPSQRNWGERELIISTPAIEWFNSHYIPGNVNPRDPDVSPLYAKLHDMPPALFTVGTIDPLLDDSLFMYSRWIAAGNRGELAVYPGGTHGFNLFPIKIAREANDRMYEFIMDSLSE